MASVKLAVAWPAAHALELSPDGKQHSVGDTVDVPAETAQTLIAGGIAVPAKASDARELGRPADEAASKR